MQQSTSSAGHTNIIIINVIVHTNQDDYVPLRLQTL